MADFRLILVGSQRYGSDWVANTVLGGKYFEWGERTARSVTNVGEVGGKTVQLVKAPVWLRGYHLRDTATLVKEELILCLDRCSPGPHAFLLMVEVDLPFTSACARAVKEHLGLFGEGIWSHTIVLFTCGDWLGSTTIEEYITGEGSELGNLLQKCGNRYYLFDSSKDYQIKAEELLQMIEQMMTNNKGRCFEVDRNKLQEIVKRREDVLKKAEARKSRMKERREQEKKLNQGNSSSELTIILLGSVLAKKSFLYNLILGHVNEGRTKLCSRKSIYDGKQKLTVVDTPGWWKFFPAKFVAKSVKYELLKAVQGGKGDPFSQNHAPDTAATNRAFLLVIPADTSYKEEQLGILLDNMKLFSLDVWENTILVFSRGSWLGTYSIEEHIESEGEALTRLVEKCGNRYHVICNAEEEVVAELQVTELLSKVREMITSNMSKARNLETPVMEDCPVTDAGYSEREGVLRKIVKKLHRDWDWKVDEIEAMERRLATRFLQRERSMSFSINFSTAPRSRLAREVCNREKTENDLREEFAGRTLVEAMQIALWIYFQKDLGVFDLVSVISEQGQFDAEWKSLFQREWARREVRLIEHLLERRDEWRDADGAASEPGPKDMKKAVDIVCRWLAHLETSSTKTAPA